MLTCPNSLLFRVRTSLRHPSPSLFISLCPFPSSFCRRLISFPFTTLCDLSHFNYSSSFQNYRLLPMPFLSVSASFSPSKTAKNPDFFLLMRADTDSCGRCVCFFCAVRYTFRHVKELYPRMMELHAQIPSAPTTFQRLC